MAILLPKSDALILEVTKTGSKWLRAAVANSGVAWEQIGPPAWRGHGTLPVHGRAYSSVACFVRNPITWYASYWAWRVARGWRPQRYELDRLCMSDSYDDFIRHAATKVPGFLTGMFEQYAGSESQPISFIGRQESLGIDLCRYLDGLGESFDAEAVINTPRVNVSESHPPTFFSTNLLIYVSEFKVFERFGYPTEALDEIQLRRLRTIFPRHAAQLQRLALATDKMHWSNDDARTAAGEETDKGRRCARILTNFGLYCELVLGDEHEAGRCYRSAVSMCPTHARSLGNLGRHLGAQGATREAVDLLRRSLQLRSNQPEMRATLAQLLEMPERIDA